jgi:antitoxin ParD1/3/4
MAGLGCLSRFDFGTPRYQYLVNEENAMARNTSVSLGDHFEEFIAGQVDSGRYGSASEVVRAGLRLLETNESKLETLRKALVAGERSGRAKYSYESLVSELDAEGK